MNFLLVLLLGLFHLAICWKWSKYVGFDYEISVSQIKVDSEGNIYVFGPDGNHGIDFDFSTHITKLTPLGDMIFSKFITSDTLPVDFVILPDGSTTLLISNAHGTSGYLLSLTSEGDLIRQTYFSSVDLHPNALHYDEDEEVFLVGGFVVKARRRNHVEPTRRSLEPYEDLDALLVKFSQDFREILWSKKYNLYSSVKTGDELVSIHPMDDESYLVVGNSDTEVEGGFFKTNMTFSRVNKTNGNILYSYVVGGTFSDEILTEICLLSDGSYGFLGESYIDYTLTYMNVGRVTFSEEEHTLHWMKYYYMDDPHYVQSSRCVGGEDGSIYVVSSYYNNLERRINGNPTLVLTKYDNDGYIDMSKGYLYTNEGKAIHFNETNDELLLGGRSTFGYIFLARASSLTGEACPDHEFEFNSEYTGATIYDDYYDIGGEDGVTIERWDLVEEVESELSLDEIGGDYEIGITEEFLSDLLPQCYFCHGLWNEEGACSAKTISTPDNIGGGLCLSEDTCYCYPGYDVYDTTECSVTTCNGILWNDTTNPDMCHGHGNCTGYNDCECSTSAYEGDDCELTFCSGRRSDEPIVCNGNGTCWPHEICQCNTKYYGVACQVTECGGILSNDTSEKICSGVGVCVRADVCDCQFNLNPYKNCIGCAEGWFTHWASQDCNITQCDGIWSNDTENVCNFGNGTCVNPNSCVCDSDGIWAGSNCEGCIENLHGVNCDIPTCFGVIANYTNGITDATGNETCSGHGECYAIDECRCFDDDLWLGDNCEIPKCFKVSAEDTEEVCWGQGECVYADTCVCVEGFYGSSCMERIGRPVFTSSVLNRLTLSYFLLSEEFEYEKAELKDGERFNCSSVLKNWNEYLIFNSSYCQFSFVSVDVGDEDPIEFCEQLIINIIDQDEILETRRRSEVTPEEYQLPVNYTLELETITYPYVIIKLQVETYIEPVDPDDGDDDGDLDDVGESGSSYIWAAIVFPVLFFVFIGLGCVIFCCLCLLCIVVIITTLCCLVFGGSGSSIFVYHQKKALSKFEELDNFDLLLNEQKLMKSNTAPRIKIRKELFEIDSKKIKLLSVLGDGGSEAVVYKAEWGGKIVAFKSFKSRSVCGSQIVMDEFEREASLMSSISHPSIIQFFGCCYKDPRVGFVMEYCSNGDLADYMNLKHQKKEVFLFQEKVRIMCEISSAMSYLHGRKVIHRDLKLENVLLDDNLSCKVMDFGISRVFEQTKQAKTKGIGTSIYISPEMVMGSMYNEKCDVYSFAILCHILFYENQHPYGNNCEYVEAKVASNPFFRPRFKRIENTGFVGYSHPIPKWLKNLIMNMWCQDAFKRKSFTEIHQFLADKILKKEDVLIPYSEQLQQQQPAVLQQNPQQLRLQQQQMKSTIEEDDDDDSSNIFFFMKLASQNESKAEQFYLEERKLESLMKLANEKYPPPRYNIKRLQMFSGEDNTNLEGDKVIENDEDVIQWVTNDCLVDVEEYDQRDQELVILKNKNLELTEKMERIKKLLLEKIRDVKQVKAKLDPLRYSKLLDEDDNNELPSFLKQRKKEEEEEEGEGDDDDVFGAF